MKYSLYILKRRIEDVFIFPFILIGRLLAKLDPLPQHYTRFFFFPFYHTGGAEKVHALIAQAAGDKNAIICFTRKSGDNTFYTDFERSRCTITDISGFTNNKFLYFLNLVWRGKITAYINGQQNPPVVLNGQSNFGYKITPWVRSNIKQVELIHSFNSFSWIRLPFLPFIDQTIMISKLRIAEHLQQYAQLQVPESFHSTITFIQNAIELPAEQCIKNFEGNLKLLFVGRGTPEKRPELFLRIAAAALQNKLAVECTLVGEMDQSILNDLPLNTKAKGNIADAATLHQLYFDYHIPIIPSKTQAFPIFLN